MTTLETEVRAWLKDLLKRPFQTHQAEPGEVVARVPYPGGLIHVTVKEADFRSYHDRSRLEVQIKRRVG